MIFSKSTILRRSRWPGQARCSRLSSAAGDRRFVGIQGHGACNSCRSQRLDDQEVFVKEWMCFALEMIHDCPEAGFARWVLYAFAMPAGRWYQAEAVTLREL
jgi:hypothetical protein